MQLWLAVLKLGTVRRLWKEVCLQQVTQAKWELPSALLASSAVCERDPHRCVLRHARVVVEGPELLQAVQAVVHLVVLQHKSLKVLTGRENRQAGRRASGRQ